jgi:hypothetical protein
MEEIETMFFAISNNIFPSFLHRAEYKEEMKPFTITRRSNQGLLKHGKKPSIHITIITKGAAQI